ncbi:hypothetical protein ACQP1G_05530 [Nocardia sp. CA-107356]|uniref:hypothetical protein n=1 Tax=Nocardia sp. CA-107356 TaxID=3239972 RepID=UPI003D91A320
MRKLELAPTDSAPKHHTADGEVIEVGEDGWPSDYEDPSAPEVVQPARAVDIERS